MGDYTFEEKCIMYENDADPPVPDLLAELAEIGVLRLYKNGGHVRWQLYMHYAGDDGDHPYALGLSENPPADMVDADVDVTTHVVQYGYDPTGLPELDISSPDLEPVTLNEAATTVAGEMDTLDISDAFFPKVYLNDTEADGELTPDILADVPDEKIVDKSVIDGTVSLVVCEINGRRLNVSKTGSVTPVTVESYDAFVEDVEALITDLNSTASESIYMG